MASIHLGGHSARCTGGSRAGEKDGGKFRARAPNRRPGAKLVAPTAGFEQKRAASQRCSLGISFRYSPARAADDRKIIAVSFPPKLISVIARLSLSRKTWFRAALLGRVFISPSALISVWPLRRNVTSAFEPSTSYFTT